MEERFRTIVEHVFNNWTGLQLAVEHNMGGTDSRQTTLECMDYMTNFCLQQPNIQVSDIQEALEDIMDEEFDTICEDNSPNEIANLLFRFLSLLREGNLAECEQGFQNLPTCKLWLSRPQPQPPIKPVEEAGSSNIQQGTTSNADVEVPMEEDSEWTEVKSRRKR